MNIYKYKSKIICYSTTDGSTVATWFRDVTVSAMDETSSISIAKAKMESEYVDSGIRVEVELTLIDTELGDGNDNQQYHFRI